MEVLIGDVISGREEMQEKLTEEMHQMRAELDRQTVYLKNIRAQLRRFSPRTMFAIIVGAFLLWCAFLWFVSHG